VCVLRVSRAIEGGEVSCEDDAIYAEPRVVADASDCYFYHTIDLPVAGTVGGDWDLRGGLNTYLGCYEFRGKRVLDVGAANGILSFFMEDQGAEVVSFDLDQNGEWDMVPFFNWPDYEHIARDRKTIIDRLNNAYWFAHRLRQSRAKVVYGNVYRIPGAIGAVDVAVYGSILLHLRDPFLALQSGLKLTREAVIVAEALRGQVMPTTEAYLGFLPDATTIEPKDTWWDLRPEAIVRMIGVLGFTDVTVTRHTQKYKGGDNPMYTVVGRRPKKE
jgi:hypothetical protein